MQSSCSLVWPLGEGVFYAGAEQGRFARPRFSEDHDERYLVVHDKIAYPLEFAGPAESFEQCSILYPKGKRPFDRGVFVAAVKFRRRQHLSPDQHDALKPAAKALSRGGPRSLL